MKYQLHVFPKNEKEDIDLLDTVWLAKWNEDLVKQYLHIYKVNQHQGTKKVKTRGEVELSRKKVWAQKGTGKARHGAKSAPIWVGGGKAFGPRPYTKRLIIPKFMSKKALSVALSNYMEKNLIDFFDYTEKLEDKFVKSGLQVLQNLKKQYNKVGIVVSENNKQLEYMFRNLPQVKIYTPRLLNAYDVINVQNLLIDKNSIKILEKRLSC